jgi:hypothetical protein
MASCSRMRDRVSSASALNTLVWAASPNLPRNAAGATHAPVHETAFGYRFEFMAESLTAILIKINIAEGDLHIPATGQ